jgi:hypothetical protein
MVEKYQCDYRDGRRKCEKVFDTLWELKEHLRKDHGVEC